MHCPYTRYRVTSCSIRLLLLIAMLSVGYASRAMAQVCPSSQEYQEGSLTIVEGCVNDGAPVSTCAKESTVAIRADGKFIVAWQTCDYPHAREEEELTARADVAAQRMYADGEALGSPALLSDRAAYGYHWGASLAFTADGNVLAGWVSKRWPSPSSAWGRRLLPFDLDASAVIPQLA
jgi:hypothetical protein